MRIHFRLRWVHVRLYSADFSQVFRHNNFCPQSFQSPLHDSFCYLCHRLEHCNLPNPEVLEDACSELSLCERTFDVCPSFCVLVGRYLRNLDCRVRISLVYLDSVNRCRRERETKSLSDAILSLFVLTRARRGSLYHAAHVR